jgi:hypothetical protein
VLCERISSELETRLRSDNQRALAVTEKALQHMSSALAMSMQEATKTSKAQFTQQAYAALSSEVRNTMRPPMRTPHRCYAEGPLCFRLTLAWRDTCPPR